MITPIETLRANMDHLAKMALIYGDACVNYHQAGDDNHDALAILHEAHSLVMRAAQIVAETL